MDDFDQYINIRYHKDILHTYKEIILNQGVDWYIDSILCDINNKRFNSFTKEYSFILRNIMYLYKSYEGLENLNEKRKKEIIDLKRLLTGMYNLDTKCESDFSLFDEIFNEYYISIESEDKKRLFKYFSYLIKEFNKFDQGYNNNQVTYP